MVGASRKYWDAMHWQIRAHANTVDVARHSRDIALQQLSSVGVRGQSAVDLPIFSRPGPIPFPHIVVGNQQLLVAGDSQEPACTGK